ncbi:Serine/threonine protein kinase [Mycena venus]|uniref:Serine/threonine protein kinase n=1 Tax=Mycena venus TaxID=2733690 RepID=A0A8H6XP75_9AGAR|nr:Serine/threonine protein kinase [Mycena venus]
MATAEQQFLSAFEAPSSFTGSADSTQGAFSNRKATSPYTGQIASFLLLLSGLEANLRQDPVFFDFHDSLQSPRTPLDSGTFFTVERAEWSDPSSHRRQWGKFVALKYVRMREGHRDPVNWNQILLEIRALLHQPIRYHPNIVRLLGVGWGAPLGTRSNFPLLVLEYAEFGSLAHLQTNESPFPLSVKKKLCHDVAKGLAILHACDIVHGDLKHENVLVFRNKTPDAQVTYTAKLADFGGSVMDIQEMADQVLFGTPLFNAPESIRGLRGDELKLTDVYSLGLLVWRTILDGNSPFAIQTFAMRSSQSIEELKRADKLLPMARESALDHIILHATDDEMEIVDFVLQNTLQALPHRRSLTKTIAALQVQCVSEINDLLESVENKNKLHREAQSQFPPVRAHGVNATAMGLFLAKTDFRDYDYQSEGPGSSPKLPVPDSAAVVFHAERLKLRLDWSLQVNILNHLEDAAAARSSTSATYIRPVCAAFYLFRCYVDEFGAEFSPQKACYWLRQAALSQDQCQENYLAQAWCWRIHKALCQPLDVEPSVLRDWLMMAILRGHRRCRNDLRQAMSLVTEDAEKQKWQDALNLGTFNLFRGMAGIGMPYFVPRKLRRNYDLDNVDTLDRDIETEFNLRGINSVDQIYVDEQGDGLLHFAASQGKLAALQHIVANYQPNIDLPNQARSETPLFAACRSGHMSCAMFLLDVGARPDGAETSSKEERPLYWLCSFTEKDVPIIAQKLVAAGASLSAEAEKKRHILHFARVWADPENLLCLPVSPLSRAVIMQNVPAVKALLSLGADPMECFEPQRKNGFFQADSACPVIVAAILTLPRILEWLLSYVDPSRALFSPAEMLELSFGPFPIPAVDATSLQSRLSRCGKDYKSSMFKTLQILHTRETMLSAEEMQARSRSENYIVARMVSAGKFDVVESLLRLGYSVHGGVADASPIVEAVRFNHESLFRLLISHGANIHTTIVRDSGDHLSLLQVAADRSPRTRTGIAIAEYLIKMGISVDHPADGARSAFVFAVKNQNFELADLLLQHGADLDFQYRTGPNSPWITVLNELVRNLTEQNLDSIEYLLGSLSGLASPSDIHISRTTILPSSIVDKTNHLSILHVAAIHPPKTKLESSVLAKMLAYILSPNTYGNSAIINRMHPEVGTPLWAATLCCNVEVVVALVEAGADAGMEFMGYSPREVALLEIERLRMESGIDSSAFSRSAAFKSWMTLLHYLPVLH